MSKGGHEDPESRKAFPVHKLEAVVLHIGTSLVRQAGKQSADSLKVYRNSGFINLSC